MAAAASKSFLHDGAACAADLSSTLKNRRSWASSEARNLSSKRRFTLSRLMWRSEATCTRRIEMRLFYSLNGTPANPSAGIEP